MHGISQMRMNDLLKRMPLAMQPAERCQRARRLRELQVLQLLA